MTYTTILEKLLTLINVISTSYIYIGFGIISILLLLLLIFKKISKKTCFIIISIITKLILGYTVYLYYDTISKLINDIVDNIFLNIYFPSIYAYLFVILIINIFTITNILKPKGEKVYKTINGVTLTLTNFILILILEILAKNKIEVFNKASIFSNPTLITLLELSINIFIIWLISLLSTYIINNITTRIILRKESRKLAQEPAVLENNIQELTPVFNPAYAFIPEETNKFIPNFTISTKELEEYKELNNEVKEEVSIIENKILNDNTFDLSAFIPKKQVPEQLSIVEEKQSTPNDILDKILNNNLSFIKEEVKEDFTEVKNTYTLNDYRIFNKMLKDIKEHNGNNSVTIDKMMEYRLITKYSNEAYDMFKTMLKIYSN